MFYGAERAGAGRIYFPLWIRLNMKTESISILQLWDSSTKRMRHWGACDGRAQVTLGYRSGGQSDWGQTDYIRTKWQEVGLTALSSSPTTNMDLLCQLTYRLHMHSTLTAYNKKMSPEKKKKKKK